MNSFLGNKCIVFVIYGFIGNVLVVSVVIDDNVFVGVGVVWNFEDYVVRLSVEESVSFYVEFDLKGLFLCLYVSKYYGVFYGDGGSWYVGWVYGVCVWCLDVEWGYGFYESSNSIVCFSVRCFIVVVYYSFIVRNKFLVVDDDFFLDIFFLFV